MQSSLLSDLSLCEFGSWYPLLSKYSIKSKIIELSPSVSDQFINYLHQDGIVLPSKHASDSDSDPYFPTITSQIEEAIKGYKDGSTNFVCHCSYAWNVFWRWNAN